MTEDMGEPEACDDSISLTSTVSSANLDRYDVDLILAERKVKGVTEYLTAWKDYPEQFHSWLPKENFVADDVFNEWERTKILIASGCQKTFDVKAWSKRCTAIKEATRLRKERRRDKRIRFGIQDEITSGSGEQDANIEGSGSEPAPRQSDKRIKRKSVHQDSPPSSSISEPSSNSDSEDSDRLLISRQESEIFNTNSKWTQAETIALEEGLRTLEGPRWKELLGLYGRNGTISQVLKDKTPGDLYHKAKSVRQEFVDSGREPPEYLKPFSRSASRKGSMTARPKFYSQSRGQSRAASKKSSRSTSADSMMAELQEKQRIREAKNRKNDRSKQATDLTDNLDSVKEREERSNTAKKTSSSKPKAHQASQAPARKLEVALGKETLKEIPKAAQPKLPPQEAFPHPEGTAEVKENTWSGTARAPTVPVSKSSQRGAVGSGPTRINSAKSKPKLGQIEPKKPSVTSDITAVWNAEPKKRKSNNCATRNADPVDGQDPKRHYSLSVQNKIYKSRRDGRAPDPSRLIFIDPKTGKAPITLPTPSTTAMLSKPPLQLHHEEFATSEAEERQAQEVEDAMLVSTSEPDPPPHSMDKDREIRVDGQGVDDPGSIISDASVSVPRPNADDMTDGRPHIDSLTPTPSASSHSGPPLNAPTGPRDETKRLATMSLQDYTSRSISSTNVLTDATINSHRSSSSNDYSGFTLRNYPSWELKNEIFNKLDTDLVIGDIKLGNDDQGSMNVKLVGFGFELKKLILTVKSSPRTVHFMFETVCLASEYQTYFPAEPSDYLGSGSIVSYSQSASAVENITETLAKNLQGALFFAQQYTMLMYPAGASAWAFLDNRLPVVHPGTSLRFVVRKPLPPTLADAHGLATARIMKNNSKRYKEIATKIKKYPIQSEDKNINIVFRDIFDIDFGRLVAQNGPQQHPPTNIFFLCFIPQGCENYESDPTRRLALRMTTSEEHDLFIRFLQANGAEEIYSMQNIGSQEIENNGAWDYFLKSVKSGTIIFHDAFIRYDLVPRLAKHLLHGSVNVWKTSLSPMHPVEKHPHLVRLFPHGGVLLLTESLVLYRPREALRMLMWLRRVQIPGKAPGTWKLAVRPRIREWLLDIMDAYSDSGKDIFGCSMQIFADIYTEIYWLLQKPGPGDNGLMCHAWDYEIPTDEAPIVSSSSLRVLQARKEWKGEGVDREPDDINIKQNDDLLVQWFAEWAIANLHNFRKYNVILGYTKDHPFSEKAISAYEKAWGHIEVMTCEDAYTRHKVTAQSKLDEMEVERRRKLKEELPAKRAAAIQGRKEEREAAKMALEARMQVFRDVGATEEEVVRAGRQLLRHLGGSEKEIAECKVDMNRMFVDRWWEESVKA